MLRLFCLLSVCLSVCLSDVNSAWAKFRREKYTSFVITEGVGDDGEPVETIEDNINTLSKFKTCAATMIHSRLTVQLLSAFNTFHETNFISTPAYPPIKIDPSNSIDKILYRILSNRG